MRKLYKAGKFADEFNDYIVKIKEHNPKDKNLKALENITASLKSSEKEKCGVFLRMIYMERNIYYHTEEAVKMGMSYSNRKKLLELSYKTLKDYILTIVNSLLKNVD